MHKNLPKKGKVTATFITMLLITTLLASFTPKATAIPALTALTSTATPTISIDPINGTVGTEVKVNGTIDTFNGSYTVRWDETINVTTGYAVGYNVATSFVIPQTVGAPLPGREVLVELIDNNKTMDNIVNTTFKLYTKYHIKAAVPSPPSQLQEGQTTDIWVNVTGGEANTVYFANVTVKEPPPANSTYWAIVSLTNTTTTGYGKGSITYPANFIAGAHTNYTGIYNIAFNETLTAPANFTVGLTDATEYYRFQVVSIRATSYTQLNECAWVNITCVETGETVSSENVPAVDGVIEANWTIPSNALLGVYTVTVTNSTTPGTIKPVPDTQNFMVIEKIIPISIDPTSGSWGTTVRVGGEIVKPGGPYQIKWDNKTIKTGNCSPNRVVVNDMFIVPPSFKGDHNITLYDVNQTKESMPATFEVTTSCYVLAEPARIFEGLSPTIIVGVRDAEANVTYTFTINVTDPLNRTWTKSILVTIKEDGSGNSTTKYPGDFEGADTDYLGNYSIAVNATLATGSFTVGLTVEVEYRRTNRVWIQGSGYKEGEIVTVNITNATRVSVEGYPKNVTAGADRLVGDVWTIPEDADLGIYIVTLSNATTPGTVKPLPDIQNFTVIEIIVYCQTRNKYDKEPLFDVTINVIDPYGRDVASGKTNKTGLVDFRLDWGTYTFNAYWKGVQVGVLENQSVIGEAVGYVLLRTFNITCELAHITIAINDEAGVPLPFINVTLTSKKTGLLPFETDYTGIVSTNTFTNTSYTIEARRYGHLFNTTPIDLFNTTWINITCPTYTLFTHVLDSKRLPLQNVQVEVYEWSSERLIGSKITNDLGSVPFDCTFGRYKIKVRTHSAELNRTVVLNETVIDVVEDRFFFVIHCKISNLDLSVAVVDYFGQPLPNAKVKVEREFEEGYVNIANLTTGSDGTVYLPKIGGNYRISVYVMGKLCETKTLHLDESKVIKFKIDKFVVVVGHLLEVTQLVACISLGMLVVLFALALIYRRLRLRKFVKEEKKVYNTPSPSNN